jgi:hypothetical protein
MPKLPKSGSVRPSELNIDHTYQRPLEPTRLEKAPLDPFDPQKVGSISVSRRADGTLWAIDGQHRMAKARLSGHSDTEFPAQIHEGLTPEDEASMFIALNDFKNIHTLYRFKARRAAGEKKAQQITEIAEGFGWKIQVSNAAGSICAVGAMEWVTDGAGLRTDGDQYEALARTLEILTGAYGHNANGVSRDLIKGVGLVVLRHGPAVDTAKLVREMGGIAGGPNALQGRAKALQSVRGGPIPHSLAEIVVELNNKGRRTNVLPQWTRTGKS